MRPFCLAFALVTAACGTAATPEAPEVKPDAVEVKDATPKAPEAGPAETWKGTLTWTDNSGRMSLDAYLGTDFSLATEKGPVVLGPSATVSKEVLEAMNGKAVTVTCISRPQAPPDPSSSFPVGPDGQPVARPAICEVTAITSP